MSKDKMDMPTKAQILETAKSCPQAKDALKKLFPKAFDGSGVNLINECSLEMRADLCIVYDHDFVGVVNDISYPASPGRFKVTYSDNGRLDGIYAS